MSEPERKNPAPEEKPSVTYATPVMRVWAWVGVLYMIIIVLLFTLYMARAEFIHGLGSLMMIPALGGLAGTAVVQYRNGPKNRQRLLLCVLTVAITAAFSAWGLLIGTPVLLAGLGG